MKKKVFCLLISIAVMALFTLPVFAQQHHHIMIKGQKHMMNMHQMKVLMDSTMNWSKMMRQHMKGMDYHHMRGGKMGMNSMTGMSLNLERMAYQMKNMSEHMEIMMNSEEMTVDDKFKEQMNNMHEMMFKTSQNLQEMTKMMSKMKDQVYKEKEEE